VSTASSGSAEPTPPRGVRVAELPGRGRGVVAVRTFAAGDVVERAPVIVVPRADVAPLRGTLLDDYWFWWDDGHVACALGWASLYNHACPANATFARDERTRTLLITAARPIAAGDEVTINYHGEPGDARPVWFTLAPRG
jgi:SET domain-containing protein